MNGNSSKQVLLSVLGIAVLVIAVVGVSFAFFSYSKTGDTNNVVTAGTIFFQYTEGTDITLTNQFPLTDADGMALTGTSTLEFHVRGYDGSGVGINYTVSATTPTNAAPTVTYANPAYNAQTNPDVDQEITEPRTRLNDSGIKLYLTCDKTGTGYTNNFGAHTGGNYDVDPASTYGAFVSSQVASGKTLADGITLATGVINSGTEAQPQDDTYVLHMWISSDAVSLDGNETEGNNDNVYTPAEFAKKYYSLRVDVSATATR